MAAENESDTLESLVKDKVDDNHDGDNNESGKERTKEKTKPIPDHPVDTGWAWVVLSGCTFEIFIYGGLMKSFGVFFLEYQKRFNSNASETALMSLIQNVLISASALFIMNVGLQKFTARTMVFTGGVITALAYVITAFTTNLQVFYFAQGALTGIGMAMIHPPMLATLGIYFDKHRGLANSIYMSGASVGGLVFAPIVVNLFEEYGYFGAMLIVSALLGNICVGACLLRPTKFYSKKKKLKSVSNPLEKEIEKRAALLRTTSHDPTMYESSQPESPLLQRVRASSVGRPFQVPRQRTMSESVDGEVDHVGNGLHGSKGKLHDMFESISRSQRNMLASDGIFGSYLDVSQPALENEECVDVKTDELSEENPDTKQGCLSGSKKYILDVLCNIFDLQLLRDPLFIAFLFMAFMFIAGIALAPAYVPQFCREIGITNEQIGTILSIMAAIDLVSKITVGYIADRGWIKRNNILIIIAVLFGTASHLLIFVNSFNMMIIFAVIIGLCNGQYTSMYAVVLQDVTGPEKFTKSLGFGTLVHGTSVAIFFPIAGLIRDITGTYVKTYHLFGGLAYAAGAFVFVISLITKRKANKKKNDKKLSQEIKI